MTETPRPDDPEIGPQPDGRDDERPELAIESVESRSSQPLSPSAARRRLGEELRLLREQTEQTLAEAGAVIQRSAATVSRFEAGRYVPRNVDINALLDHYRSIRRDLVTNDLRERLLYFATEGRKKQWFQPFRDALTGDMIPDHQYTLVEHETDALDIRSYESDLVPGLLQTYNYAKAIAELFFPNRDPADHIQFVEFRMARQASIRARLESLALSIVVNEVALRRLVGGEAVLREQLDAILAMIDGRETLVDVRVIPLANPTPAALGGPFVVFSGLGAENSDDKGDVVYLETRSGGNYLAKAEDVVRFNAYFDNLTEACLTSDDAAALIRSIITDLPPPGP